MGTDQVAPLHHQGISPCYINTILRCTTLHHRAELHPMCTTLHPMCTTMCTTVNIIINIQIYDKGCRGAVVAETSQESRESPVKKNTQLGDNTHRKNLRGQRISSFLRGIVLYADQGLEALDGS